MEKITITNQKQYIETGHSSKGNQLKWKDEPWWYKADQMGYESLAETVVSRILCSSDIREHVIYEPVQIVYQDKELMGCRSKNFLGEREELITLEKLFRQHTGMSLAKELSYISDTKKRIAYTVDHVISYTGLTDFGAYLTEMLEMDAFFLNEDRHTNNIAMIYRLDDKSYRLCPSFDMGLSLFADMRGDFPLSKPMEDCRKDIIAKPFARDFEEQADASGELYGTQLIFCISKNEMVKEVRRYEDIYPKEVIDRVEETLRYQADKYSYMICKKG